MLCRDNVPTIDCHNYRDPGGRVVANSQAVIGPIVSLNIPAEHTAFILPTVGEMRQGLSVIADHRNGDPGRAARNGGRRCCQRKRGCEGGNEKVRQFHLRLSSVGERTGDMRLLGCLES